MFDVGAQLRRMRRKAKFTLDQLASTSGVDRGTISRIELGHVSPRIETISFLCEAMGTTLGEFFGGAPALPDPPPGPESPSQPARGEARSGASAPEAAGSGAPRLEAEAYWPVPANFWKGLLEVQERFEVLVRNCSELILVLDMDGFIRYASPASNGMLGLRGADLVGQHCWALIHPSDLPGFEALLERLRPVANASGKLDCRLRDRQGHWHWASCRVNNQSHNPSVLALVVNASELAAPPGPR
jgi:PAS domain S-box-containing protein